METLLYDPLTTAKSLLTTTWLADSVLDVTMFAVTFPTLLSDAQYILVPFDAST